MKHRASAKDADAASLSTSADVKMSSASSAPKRGRGTGALKGPRTTSFPNLVRWLINRKIMSEDDWIACDIISYATNSCDGVHRNKAKRALSIARRFLCPRETVLNYITSSGNNITAKTNKKNSTTLNCKETPGGTACDTNTESQRNNVDHNGDMHEVEQKKVSAEMPANFMTNTVFQILRFQGLDVHLTGQLFSFFFGTRDGPKNCILLEGPPGSGTVAIANAICMCVPSICVLTGTPTDDDLMSCSNKLMIWWRDPDPEYIKTSDQCQSLICGLMTAYRIKGSLRTLPRIPIIITSNKSIIPDVPSTENIEMVKSKMWKIRFPSILPGGLNCVKAPDMKDFFSWMMSIGTVPGETTIPAQLFDAFDVGHQEPVRVDSIMKTPSPMLSPHLHQPPGSIHSGLGSIPKSITGSIGGEIKLSLSSPIAKFSSDDDDEVIMRRRLSVNDEDEEDDEEDDDEVVGPRRQRKLFLQPPDGRRKGVRDLRSRLNSRS